MRRYIFIFPARSYAQARASLLWSRYVSRLPLAVWRAL